MPIETVLAIVLAIAVAVNVVLLVATVAVRRTDAASLDAIGKRELVAATRGTEARVRTDGTASRVAPEAAVRRRSSEPEARPAPDDSPEERDAGRAHELPNPDAWPFAASDAPAGPLARRPVVLPRDLVDADHVRGTPRVAARFDRVDRVDRVDALTGLETPVVWELHLDDEASRIARYARPAAVVLAELSGMHRLEERFGEEHVRPIVAGVGEVFRREARRCDRVARVGPARYAVLLPETTEEQAVNYLDRVRAAADRWLDEGGVAIRLAAGIASPGPSGRLDTALRVAEARMYADARAAAGPESSD